MPIIDDNSDFSNTISDSDLLENCNHVYASNDSVSGQPKAIPQQKLCYHCELPGHIANYC